MIKILCVGTGRDGTTSLAGMIEDAFEKDHLILTIMHEWASTELNSLFCEYRETLDDCYVTRIKELIHDCPYDCVVGNGYAAILPLFREVCGPNLKIVHIKRHAKLACIESLVRNSQLFPWPYKYYIDSADATDKRMAAFHFNEMPMEEWLALPINTKFEWYYDKTHELIKENLKLFEVSLLAETESLSSEEFRQMLQKFLCLDNLPPLKHLNKHVELDTFNHDNFVFVQRLIGKLDVSRLGKDPIYGLSHFLDEFSLYLLGRFAGASGSVDFQSYLSESLKLLDAAIRRLSLLSNVSVDGGGDVPLSSSNDFQLSQNQSIELVHHVKRLNSEICERIAERDKMIAERDEALVQLGRLRVEVDERVTERDKMIAERDEALVQFARLRSELDERIAERDKATTERDQIRAKLAGLIADAEGHVTEIIQ